METTGKPCLSYLGWCIAQHIVCHSKIELVFPVKGIGHPFFRTIILTCREPWEEKDE